MEGGYERVKDELDRRGLIVSAGYGGSIHAKCPAHDDHRPSLTLSEGDDGKALLYDHGGCETPAIASALGLSMSDLFHGSDAGAVAAVYTYTDESGTPLFRVLRRSPKTFYLERRSGSNWERGLEDTRRVIYQLPLVLKGVANGDTVWITEGEKDAESIIDLGLVATCPLGGANGRWLEEWTPVFTGATVIICADNDQPGIKRAREIEVALQGTAASVEVRVPLEGKDVSDHLRANHSIQELRRLDDDGLEILQPIDFESYAVEETEWLYEPYIPVGGRVLAFGPAGSLKSLWAMWLAGYLSCVGNKVAYFSLEMRPSQTVKRLRQVKLDRDNFQLFTKFNFMAPEQVLAITKGLRGTDLIVVDSWSSAHGDTNNNDAVARLDNDVFQPIIEATGAALLILDNVGKEAFDASGHKIEQTQARGASAKGDKMEITLSFNRPDKQNNYRTRIKVEKMRLDRAIPSPIDIETPAHIIDFRHHDAMYGNGQRLGDSAPELRLADSGPGSQESDSVSVSDSAPKILEEEQCMPKTEDHPSDQMDQPQALTVSEKLALARLKDKLGATEIPKEEE